MLYPVHLRFLDTQGSAVAGGPVGVVPKFQEMPQRGQALPNSRGCQQWPPRAGSTIPRGPGLAVTLPPALPSPGRKSGTLWETGPGD